MVPAGKAHKPPHTVKIQLHHFSDLWMEDMRSQSLSPRHGVCAAGCGFTPRLLCTLRYRIRGHPFFPPYSPREEHLATMTITCRVTAASHTHVQPKQQPTFYASVSRLVAVGLGASKGLLKRTSEKLGIILFY